MTVGAGDRAAIEAYYKAMRLGRAGAAAMAELFTDDAVYVEPFSGGDGQPRTHTGRRAIDAFFRDSINHRPPDMMVTMDRIDAEGGRIRAEWTCTASVFAGPLRGVDSYLIRNGKIARLETTVLGG